MKGIQYYDRYRKTLVREQILGEGYLRFIYGNPLGKLALHTLVKRAFFSRILGRRMDAPSSKQAVGDFIREYGIDMNEALLPAEDYATFNQFFYRRLKPGARPVCKGNTVAFPADARHSGWQDASAMESVFVKGQQFDLPALLGSTELGERYARGSIVLSRLCPTDYHRYHFAASGTPSPAHLIPGPLASVSPYCLRKKLAWLWTNKRELTLLDTSDCGTVAILAVGATGVGAIHQTYTPGQPVAKGDEQGYFAFGGSTIITFFEPGRIRLAPDLLEQTSRCTELYARQGDCMGEIIV